MHSKHTAVPLSHTSIPKGTALERLHVNCMAEYKTELRVVGNEAQTGAQSWDQS